MSTSRCRRSYKVHGVRVGISGDPAVAGALHARLGRFPASDQGAGDLSFDYCAVRDIAHHLVASPAGHARPIYSSAMGDVLYVQATDHMYINAMDRVRVQCAPHQGYTRVSAVQPGAEQAWLLSHPLFTLPFIEQLKRRGRYSLHAAGVAIDGKGVLFPGASGSGKSTLALLLARAGFGFMGDDLLFLAPTDHGLRVLAFPEEVDVTDHTIDLFPDLHDLRDVPRLPGWPKRRFPVDERYGADIVWDCQPAVLVFPHVAAADRSTLRPLERDEALLELAPNVLLTETQSSQAHLDALAALVRVSACYRLDTGRDFDALSTLLRELLEASARV